MIKWSGSKRSQVNEILKYFPKEIDTYYEPFCGGASVLRGLLDSNIKVNSYVCSDISKPLIDLWNEIKNNPKELCDYYENEREKFVIVDDGGTKKDAERLSIFRLKDSDKKYIVYTFNEVDENDMIKLYVAILNDKDGVYSLENITDSEEWTKIKDAMRKIAKDGQQVLNSENE